MIDLQSLRRRQDRILNRVHALLSTRARASAVFVTPPEPRTVGSVARGRQLLAGHLLFAGELVMAQGRAPWESVAPNPGFAAELHGFGWLHDLAAIGDRPAREMASGWLYSWIDRFGRGGGPGWTPELTGRRVIRWISHADFVMRGQPKQQAQLFHRLLAQQTHFLARRWQAAAPGLPRIEALTGLIQAGMVLEGLDHLAEPAIPALAAECNSRIDEGGAAASRNPEELLEMFSLLILAASALSEAERPVPARHLATIARIAPCLRTLRHADGGLPRFHGGGQGAGGRLDQALAASGVRNRMPDGLAMGYARLSAGRTSVVIDASAPPARAASHDGHASTLAFELTSGRRPMIVSCGSGAGFGAEWRRAGRATPSHSTLSLDGYSSARLGPPERGTGREMLVDAPNHVLCDVLPAGDGTRFQGAHDGFVGLHGLTHARTLDLSRDGRGVSGEDMLLALDPAARRRFERVLAGSTMAGLPFDIRFHLHPDARAALDPGGTAVSVILKSGEVWVFRGGGRPVRLEPSVYLDASRPKPRATQQIVLSGRAMDYATRVRWSLSKPQNTATAVRDLVQDHMLLPQD